MITCSLSFSFPKKATRGKVNIFRNSFFVKNVVNDDLKLVCVFKIANEKSVLQIKLGIINI